MTIKFLALDPGMSDPEEADQWEEVEARDISEAAEIFAETCYDASGGDFVDGNEVLVKTEPDAAAQAFRIRVDFIPTFGAFAIDNEATDA